MTTDTKLEILADAAKYDVSCASSGATTRDSRDGKGLGSTSARGICHSYTPDGRCVSLLKILLTNVCQYDCAYCINRRSSNVRRARFTIDEVVRLTIGFYRRNYIEGLFLSSGIVRSADHTMDLRRAAPFFVGRFATMRWSILTPDGSLHWDGGALETGPGMRREDAPDEDALEEAWGRYYAATFNPARANPAMMQAEMPKRYWRNLPEAALIPELLDGAAARTRAMMAATAEAPRKAIPAPNLHEPGPAGTLAGLASEIAACRRCPLHGPATQPVLGEGPPDAPVVFLGEQPGDQEDLAGRVFVGPAGQVFDQALAEAGIDRSRIYVTNAVKHFKYQVRGKRRIHQRPDSGEVEACRWWVERELALLQPRLAVALGATAARALSGHTGPLSTLRGRPLRFRDELPGLVTIHPSYLLRLPDEAAREMEHRRFVAELRQAAALVPEIRHG